ncbi:hypothetical protein IFM89_037033 [Coptis chinensis]|uniref:Uncharacterized protein n=1 Tax=Coptis chinensis TaxID=261450 RepID=A0A835HAU8_9MAGN|nr:hypothetical protein IFM89_037033 [Coptis chinensis]
MLQSMKKHQLYHSTLTCEGLNGCFAETGEVLDEMITRSRGEIRHTSSPKVTSSTSTPMKDSKSVQSPRYLDKAFSPRVSVLRGARSPQLGGRGPLSPRTGEAKPSKLGKGAQGSPLN